MGFRRTHSIAGCCTGAEVRGVIRQETAMGSLGDAGAETGWKALVFFRTMDQIAYFLCTYYTRSIDHRVWLKGMSMAGMIVARDNMYDNRQQAGLL